MMKYPAMSILIPSALVLSVLAGGPYAAAEDAGGGLKAPAVDPVRGGFSSEEARTARAAALKAKIKAVKEGKNRPVTENAVVPIGHRSVRGTNEIKAKMEASKDSGKRGTAKLQGYLSSFLGGMQSLNDALSGAEDNGELSAKQKARLKERKISFKERLKLELEKKRQRNNARNGKDGD